MGSGLGNLTRGIMYLRLWIQTVVSSCVQRPWTLPQLTDEGGGDEDDYCGGDDEHCCGGGDDEGGGDGGGDEDEGDKVCCSVDHPWTVPQLTSQGRSSNHYHGLFVINGQLKTECCILCIMTLFGDTLYSIEFKYIIL